MDEKRSKEALMAFLDYLGNKGLMAKATAQARKAAASKILGVLDEAECADVTKIDIDDAMNRFGHLEGKNYTPGSLSTYASRFRSAIEDFDAYLANPLAFRPTVQNRERQKAKTTEGTPKSAGATPTSETRPETTRPTVSTLSSGILPIPIRADLIVYIQGLPFDLSEAEAKKIAAVVTAMALPS